MNICLQETDIPQWMTQGKTYLIKKKKKRNCTQQLLTHNGPTDYMKNTNGANQGGDLLFANKPRTVSRGAERILQGNKRNRNATLHWSTHPQGHEKCNYCMDSLQKGIWYGPAKLHYGLSKNVQDIWLSYKAYEGSNEKLEWNWLQMEKFSQGENLERDRPVRRTITITICNSDDASESHA